jgi:dTDP-4-dehydrorhamnose reductase
MRIVIVGAGGRLGSALAREYRGQFSVTAFNHAELDFAAPEQLHHALDHLEFDLLINAAAQTNVDRCETHREEAFLLNAEAPRVLAEICAKKNRKLIHVSTDYVFDGEKRTPYHEEDSARPVSVYGESKRAGEDRVLEVSAGHLVVRVSWVFGPDRPSFVDAIIKRALNEEKVDAVADKFATPTYTLDLARMLKPLFHESAAIGIVHLANQGECSWQQYGQWALDCCVAADVPLKCRTVAPVSLADMKNFIAKRPVYSVLSPSRYETITGNKPRSWQGAVESYVREHVSVRLRAGIK